MFQIIEKRRTYIINSIYAEKTFERITFMYAQTFQQTRRALPELNKGHVWKNLQPTSYPGVKAAVLFLTYQLQGRDVHYHHLQSFKFIQTDKVILKLFIEK